MALGESEGMNTTMLVSPATGGFNAGYPYPVAPLYYGGNGNNGSMGFGGDWGSLIILFLLFGLFGNGGFGGGYGGGFGNNYDFPWLLNGQNQINSNISNGFQNAQLSDNITSVRDGISSLSTQMCGATGDIQMSLCNGFNNVVNSVNGVNTSISTAQNALAQQMYTNQLADLERSFAAQTASTQGMTALQAQLAQCCCDNRAATQDVKFTIAQEECATRANSTANTQAILDKLCQLELDGYKRDNDNLRSQLQFANTVVAMEQQESRESRGYSGRSYRDGGGMSGRRYRDDYSEDGISGRRYYYTQRDGVSGRRRRDSMGRYADGYSNDEAKDKLMSEMENMMGEVSPEAQHAIRKAINALGNE